MFFCSLDVKTAVDVAKPNIIEEILRKTVGVWMSYCDAAGEDEGPEGIGKLPILLDGIQMW